MNATTVWAAVAIGILAGSAAPAAAQRRDAPRDGACFYKDADYRGERFCLASGEDIGSIPWGLDDEISSIRVYGRAEVTIYKDRDFRGSSARFGGDVRDLEYERWNDRLSSIRVERRGGYGGGTGHQDAERIVRRAYQDLLEREPDAQGMRIYRSHIIDDGWDERQVRDAIRESPEYRQKNTMTWPKAQEIVRQAYLNVLKREPDPASRGYVDHVFRDKWTQADVERELRKSPEYRTRPR